MMRWIVWALRLAIAMPMMVLGLWLEDFAIWLQDTAIRIEVDQPERADALAKPPDGPVR